MFAAYLEYAGASRRPVRWNQDRLREKHRVEHRLVGGSSRIRRAIAALLPPGRSPCGRSGFAERMTNPNNWTDSPGHPARAVDDPQGVCKSFRTSSQARAQTQIQGSRTTPADSAVGRWIFLQGSL